MKKFVTIGILVLIAVTFVGALYYLYQKSEEDPKVLLADEPTGALDTKTSYEVMDLIQKINDEGRTILVVTHEHDIAQMTKRIVNLKDGLIIEDTLVTQIRASENV